MCAKKSNQKKTKLSSKNEFRPLIEGDALNIIARKLSKLKDKEMVLALESLKKALAKSKVQATSTIRAKHFNLLDLIRRVLMTSDLLFLSRQVTYHIAANAELSTVWADVDQIQGVLGQLVEHIVRRSSRGGKITIGLKQFALRSSPAVELNLSCDDKELTNSDSHDFLNEIFSNQPDKVSNISLSDLRKIVSREQGQFWVDFAKPHQPIYHLVLPATDQNAHAESPGQQTFKYDIAVSNYANVRKRFGVKKSLNLMSQIEHCVKSLVRYPIDMVISMGDKGIITTIYETQRGGAQSVASRISTRLGSEHFKIGKRPVDVSFSYHLSPLATITPAQSKNSEIKNN